MERASIKEPLQILLISVHGLIRGHELELGRDADTGGQTKYVVDFARALAKRNDVARVDLATRLVIDSEVSDDYAQEVEPIADKARIIRIEAGPETYLRKEDLWDHLDAFADNLLNWLNEQPNLPHVLHAHYADAGYIGVRLANLTGIPLVFTGHSLGRDKRRQLMTMGLKRSEIDARYNIVRRIEAEEEVLANAELIITSTHHEIEEQYEHYDYYQPERMAVIPPGIDVERFHPSRRKDTENPLAENLERFLRKPGKPIILALSRPDERKNIVSLVEAYGESSKLQKAANLVIVVGNREDIRDMESGPQSVLTEILLLIDFYDLYGCVAIPKHHKPDEVPQIYRLVAASGGVFINPALTEPFGLTLLEAAASGLPVVATENGGPVDIIANCRNGILIDPLDKQAISGALLGILHDPERWREFSRQGLGGVRKQYAWDAHARAYVDRIRPLLAKREPLRKAPVRKSPMHYHDRAIITDLDQNLIGNPKGLKDFVAMIRQNKKRSSFGIATGRRLDSALAIMKKYAIPIPDVLISSLGTELFYAPRLAADIAWANHIDHLWNRNAVKRIFDELPGLVPQAKNNQSRFKISYHYDPVKAPSLDEINTLLRQQEQTVNIIHAFGQYLDIVPVRASKGLALRHFAQLWEIPLEQILVAGGSGADEDMMRGNTLAVVVANRHHEELSQLTDQERIYFANRPYAFGILEAIDYYDFFGACAMPE